MTAVLPNGDGKLAEFATEWVQRGRGVGKIGTGRVMGRKGEMFLVL